MTDPDEAVPVPEDATAPDLEDVAAPSADATEPERAGQEPGELVIALSPRQILGGFALLAALVLLLRRGRASSRDKRG
jgi:hypothetical protein